MTVEVMGVGRWAKYQRHVGSKSYKSRFRNFISSTVATVDIPVIIELEHNKKNKKQSFNSLSISSMNEFKLFIFGLQRLT